MEPSRLNHCESMFATTSRALLCCSANTFSLVSAADRRKEGLAVAIEQHGKISNKKGISTAAGSLDFEGRLGSKARFFGKDQNTETDYDCWECSCPIDKGLRWVEWLELMVEHGSDLWIVAVDDQSYRPLRIIARGCAPNPGPDDLQVFGKPPIAEGLLEQDYLPSETRPLIEVRENRIYVLNESKLN